MNNFISDDMPEKGMGSRLLLFFQVTKLQSYKVTKLQRIFTQNCHIRKKMQKLLYIFPIAINYLYKMCTFARIMAQ